MATFLYKAKRLGQTKPETGQTEAENTAEANKKLRSQGLMVLSLREDDHRKAFGLSWKRTSVPAKEKIIFTRQLAVMIRAGLPIVKALQALQKQTESNAFKEIIADLVLRIRGGQTLSQAMHHHSKAFPEIYIAVIRAGENTGQLAEVLVTLADQQEKDADLTSKIRSAMIYPAFILGVLVIVIGIIVYFVLPNLQTVFASSGQKLPILTRVLLGFSGFFRHDFFLLVGLILAAFFGIRWWIRQPSGARFYDHLKISLPVFGNLTKRVYMARFTRTMAMLVKASLPILEAIKIVRKTINNGLYNEAFGRIERAVESGKSLSSAIEKEPLFPAMVAQLSSLGEESGSLETVLLEAANFYDKEVDTISQNLSALIEPLLIVIMGVGVGLVVVAVIGPIYNLVQTIN